MNKVMQQSLTKWRNHVSEKTPQLAGAMLYEKLGVSKIMIAVNTHQSLRTYTISVRKPEGKINWKTQSQIGGCYYVIKINFI